MRTIGGWVVTGQLGAGGGGAVLRVRDPRTGAEAALKLAAGGRPLSEHEQRRFAREVEALRRLEHPGLARLLHAGTDQGRAFLVTPLVAGESLAQRLRRGPLDEREASRIARAVADALAHAHERGVLHRDLKPENVLLTPEGAPVLIDFGLAMDLDLARSRLTQTGTFLGTPGWWPPEQALGEHARVGPASDVYGVGALLFAMLTGRPPVVAESLQEVLAAASRDVEPPSVHRPGLDRRLDRLVARCLARRPEARPESAAALARALDDLASAPAARASRRLKAAPERPAGAGVKLASALSAAAVLVAVGVVVSRRSADAPGREVAVAPADPTTSPPPPPSTLADEPAPVASQARVDAPAPPADPEPAPDARRRTTDPRELTDLDALGRRLEADPDDVEARAARAFLLASAGRVEEGEADAEQVLAAPAATAGERALAHYARARGRARRVELAAALADFDAAVSGRVAHAQVYLERGTVRLRMEDARGAAEDLTTALLEGLPGTRDEVSALIMRGMAFEVLGDADAAINDLTAALRTRGVSASDKELAFGGLRRMQQEKRIPEAGEAVRTAQSHLSAGRRAEARAELEARLAAAGDDAEALKTRGRMLLDDGDPAAAIADLDAALRLRPSWSEVALDVGRLRLATGDVRGAEAPLRTAVAGLPWCAEAWTALAAWARASGDPDLEARARGRAARTQTRTPQTIRPAGPAGY